MLLLIVTSKAHQLAHYQQNATFLSTTTHPHLQFQLKISTQHSLGWVGLIQFDSSNLSSTVVIKAMNVMFMKQSKYNSRKSFLRLADDLPIRKRNRSLGSNPQIHGRHSPSLSPPLVKNVSEIVYSCRKNRNLIKATKFKNVKFSTENTKLCQQNILQYNLLKRKMTQRNNQENQDQSPKQLYHSPKLSIKNLGIAIQHEFISKSRVMADRRHVETEPPRNIEPRRYSREDLNPIKVPIYMKKHHERFSVHLPSKKYNQLTLREIAEVEQIPKFNILMKLRELKKKDVAKRQSRRPSEDYSLEGW